MTQARKRFTRLTEYGFRFDLMVYCKSSSTNADWVTGNHQAGAARTIKDSARPMQRSIFDQDRARGKGHSVRSYLCLRRQMRTARRWDRLIERSGSSDSKLRTA